MILCRSKHASNVLINYEDDQPDSFDRRRFTLTWSDADRPYRRAQCFYADPAQYGFPQDLRDSSLRD